MSTDVAVCSSALTLLRANTISSFQAETNESEICADLYPGFVRSVLASHPWHFATKKAQLSKFIAAPLNEYTFRFVMPSDSLRFIAAYNSDQAGARPILDFDLINKEIHANDTNLYAEYVRYQTEDKWPSYFRTFFIHALASHLAIPVTGNVKLEANYAAKAFGLPSDNLNGGLFGMARKIDSQQQPPEEIDDPGNLIAARFS